MTELDKLRKNFDQINREMLKLLVKRYQLIDKVIEYKANNNLPLKDKKREDEMLELIKKETQNMSSSEFISQTFSDIFSNSVKYMKSNSKNQ